MRLYLIRLELEKIRMTHQEVHSSMLERGIGVNLHYIPVYRQPYYEKMGFLLFFVLSLKSINILLSEFISFLFLEKVSRKGE